MSSDPVSVDSGSVMTCSGSVCGSVWGSGSVAGGCVCGSGVVASVVVVVVVSAVVAEVTVVVTAAVVVCGVVTEVATVVFAVVATVLCSAEDLLSLPEEAVTSVQPQRMTESAQASDNKAVLPLFALPRLFSVLILSDPFITIRLNASVSS